MTEVYLCVTPGVLLLDLAGMAEPLRIANRMVQEAGEQPAFSLQMVAAQAQVQTSLPLTLAGLSALPPQLAASASGPAWVIVSGTARGALASQAQADAGRMAMVDWLRRVVGPALKRDEVRLWTVCSGALMAAEAGLLEGKSCTTHHSLIDSLRQDYTDIKALDDRIFVQDGAVATSAGITAGIDLALFAIARHLGEALSCAVAREMVVYFRRAGGDPQLSALVDHRNHLHPAVHRAQDAMLSAPAQAWTLERIAQSACVSERHLRRLFQEHAGLGPIEYLNRIRVSLARRALQSGQSVELAATAAGFSGARQLREVWALYESGTPSARKPKQ